MISFFYGPTPNGHKISIMLEETGLPYVVEPLNTFGGQQFSASYLAISPSAKMPAIVDDDPIGGGAPLSVFESGAILLYLARKAGRLLPSDERGRSRAEQWLFWQMSALGPMSGQAGHFRRHSPEGQGDYARDRFRREVERLYAVLDHQLHGASYVAGDYSVADVAIYPWIRSSGHFGLTLADFPEVERWAAAMAERPAVTRAYALAERYAHPFGTPTQAQRALLFACSADDMRRGYAGQIQPWG